MYQRVAVEADLVRTVPDRVLQVSRSSGDTVDEGLGGSRHWSVPDAQVLLQKAFEGAEETDDICGFETKSRCSDVGQFDTF
jgi:hypothetical protein